MALVEDQNKQQLSNCGFVKSSKIRAPRTTLASIESLTFPLVQEVVILADFRCERCQKRVADIISRMNGETESVEVNVLEKKVTLTFTSTIPRVYKEREKQVAGIYPNSVSTRFTLMKRLFGSTDS